MIIIRNARLSEIDRLTEIEDSACLLFTEAGMGWVAEQPPYPQKFEKSHRQRALWVAVDVDYPVGFICGYRLDDEFHIAEVDVARSHQGRGIGAMLVNTAIDHARQHSFPAVTLTTYRDLPWNAPFYARLGFEELSVEAAAPGLLAQRETETRAGHDPARRCMMIKRL